MANQIDLPDTPITFTDGRAQPWFAVLLRKVSATVDGILQFIDLDTGVIVSADQIEQGLEAKIEQIVKKQVTERNAAGQPTMIEHRDITTNELVKTREIAYNAQGAVSERVEKDSKTTITSDFTYDVNGNLDIVLPDVAIGGLF